MPGSGTSGFVLVLYLLGVVTDHIEAVQNGNTFWFPQPNANNPDVYNYALGRQYLQSQEALLQFDANVTLNFNEQRAAAYLDFLIRQENIRLNALGIFTPSLYFNSAQQTIAQSALYNFLQRLPKGGNLHVHDGAWGDRGAIVLRHWNDANLYVQTWSNSSDAGYGALNYFGTPTAAAKVNKGYVLLSQSGITQNEMLDLLTTRSYAPSPTTDPWVPFQAAYDRFKGMQNYALTYAEYVNASLALTLADNVQYIEMRAGFGKRYTLDPVTGDQKVIQSLGFTDAKYLQSLVNSFIEKHPNNFFGLKTIYQSARFKSNETQTPGSILKEMQKAGALRLQYPSFILGFDLVGQEDKGLPLLPFLPDFAYMANDTGVLPAHEDLPYFLHAGETSWNQDNIVPSVSVAASFVRPVDNFYDALLVNADRFGHGLALFKHPFLVQKAIERGVAVEVCPVSNQILGYYPDLRAHPAIGMSKAGLQVVLASDDPGVYGYLNLTYDFYEAAMAFDFGLSEFKQAINNSFTYSGQDPASKASMSSRWLGLWMNFVDSIQTEICTMTNTANPPPNFAFLLPSVADLSRSINISVNGAGLQQGICSAIVCQFGSMPATTGYYVNAAEILCPTPVVTTPSTMFLSVGFGTATPTFIPTGITFMAINSVPPPPGPSPPPSSPMDWKPVAAAMIATTIVFALSTAALLVYICFFRTVTKTVIRESKDAGKTGAKAEAAPAAVNLDVHDS